MMATPVQKCTDGAGPAGEIASFRVEEVRTCGVVHAVGEIDLSTSGALREAVSAAIALSPRVIVDLRLVTLLDSTGMSALVEAQSRARAGGGVVALVGPRRRVRMVLEITRLDEMFPIYDGLQEAVAALVDPDFPHR